MSDTPTDQPPVEPADAAVATPDDETQSAPQIADPTKADPGTVPGMIPDEQAVALGHGEGIQTQPGVADTVQQIGEADSAGAGVLHGEVMAPPEAAVLPPDNGATPVASQPVAEPPAQPSETPAEPAG